MANNEDYQSKLEVINAIPTEDILVPDVPVGSYLQECENLYKWALQDLEILAGIGLTKEKLDDLPVRAGACREAQSIWMKDYRSQQAAQLQWIEQSPGAYALRDELLHAMRYAYRNETSLTSRVRTIADGRGDPDMIQDLNDLNVLGTENIDLLLTVGITAEKLAQAATLSDEMADLLALANGDKAEINQSKTIRDKAYTHLKNLADEVYEAGKFLFWKDKNRIKGYTMAYWRK
ncbi:MAG: hypothetical protein PHS59_03385 [Paludibacter sp.]|nr:hypothetical protein [Paludibacter sp.]